MVACLWCEKALLRVSELFSDPKAPTPKQTRFGAEYLIDLNATQAAIGGGYSFRGHCQERGRGRWSHRYHPQDPAQGSRRASSRWPLTRRDRLGGLLDEYRRAA